MRRYIVTSTLAVALAASSCNAPEMPVCGDCVTCSGRGRCTEDRMYAECSCNQGFVDNGYRECVPDVSHDADLSWVFIPVGDAEFHLQDFLMGSPESELDRGEDERQHTVTLTQDFVILATEVTQGQFEEVMEGYLPSSGEDLDFFFNGPDYPVHYVTWHEAAAFCNALSVQQDLDPCYRCEGEPPSLTCVPEEGRPGDCEGYRLPTEAEWEYAARVDRATATYAGDLDPDFLGCEEHNPVLDSIAWFCGNAHYQARPVGTREPFDWHIDDRRHPYPYEWRYLYDMLGNVEEWCHDWYAAYPADAGSSPDPYGPRDGDERVHRGGSFDSRAQDTRLARRDKSPPGERSLARGFRVARTIPF